MGCSNAADHVFFTGETIIANNEILDSKKDKIGEIDDLIIHEEEPNPSYVLGKEEDPQEESTPP